MSFYTWSVWLIIFSRFIEYTYEWWVWEDLNLRMLCCRPLRSFFTWSSLLIGWGAEFGQFWKVGFEYVTVFWSHSTDHRVEVYGTVFVKNTLSSSATARKVSSWVCLTLTSPRYMKSRTAPSSAYGASINQPQFFNQPILLRFYPNPCSNRNIAYLRATQVEEGGGGGSARGFWRRICLKSRVTDTYLIYPIWIRTQIQIQYFQIFWFGILVFTMPYLREKKIQINISSNNKMWKRSLFKMVFHTFFVADPDFFPSCPNLVNITGTTTWK